MKKRIELHPGVPCHSEGCERKEECKRWLNRSGPVRLFLLRSCRAKNFEHFLKEN